MIHYRKILELHFKKISQLMSLRSLEKSYSKEEMDLAAQN